MKIVNFGSTFRIFGDDLKTFDKLPAATYKVDFNPMSGFSLDQVDDFKTKEEKIYGSHAEKIQKVLKSYTKFDRSMGIILSGNKGMGKSMFVQLIGEEVIQQLDIPVILVTKPFVGIADFIEEIDQEALIIFDEFEKMFSNRGVSSNREQPTHIESQDNLLGLFDGTSQKKRLYAITVNELHRVNDFMLSRPGRFHYHIRFDYPSSDEIEVYLRDKLDEAYHGEIKHVVSFANRVKLNYDSLRAIAFELNEGYTFKSSIGDLNILTTESQRFNVKVSFTDGKSVDINGQNLNLFSENIRLDSYTSQGNYFSINFNPANAVEELNKMIVTGQHVHTETRDEDGDPIDEVEVHSIIITHHKEEGVNYRVV